MLLGAETFSRKTFLSLFFPLSRETDLALALNIGERGASKNRGYVCACAVHPRVVGADLRASKRRLTVHIVG